MTETCATVRYGNELHATVERLAVGLGWPLVLADGNVYLPTSRGIVGLVVDARFGASAVGELWRRGLDGPVIGLPGEWAFLVDTPGTRLSLPVGVRVVSGARYLPLPPSVIKQGAVRWVHEPREGVPSFTAVLDVMRGVAPRAVR